METFLIGLLVLILLVWLFVRRRNSQSTTPKKTERRTTTRLDDTAYHSVAIKFSPKACAAAMALNGKRFLSSTAPHIPLPDCDVVDCQCRFMHYKDRRGKIDRRSVFSSSGLSATTGKFEQERRHGDDRRAEDEDIF